MQNTVHNKFSGKILLGIPLLIFLVVIAVELSGILFFNGGTFTYSLDDAYIHLSLAQNISDGHYGINLSEYSAPSSSIIWPFLLAIFAGNSFFEYSPIVANVLFSLGILWVAGLLFRRCFLPSPHGDLLAVLASLFLILGGNLTGLVFTGMEHSLQVLISVLIVAGLVSLCQTGRSSWWLIALMVTAPLVRYEMMALSVPAIWILLRNKKVGPAVIACLLIVGLMAGFAWFLHSMGLGFFPNSVAAKSDIISKSGPLLRVAENIMAGLVEKRGRGLFLLGMFCGFVFFRFNKKSSLPVRLISEWACMAVGLHFCCGQFGWFSRYEIYIWVASLLSMLFVLCQQFSEGLKRVSVWKLVVVLFVFFGMTSPAYLYAMLMTPVAANNIYEQQYQTRRLIADFYKQPVAVNDIGLPTFNQDLYVLDIWGLASKRALEYRTAQAPAIWMDDLAKEHGVALAVIYDTEYKPKGWVHLADWSLSRRRITPSFSTVSVFSIDPEHVDEQMLMLQSFKESLPERVSWRWVRQPAFGM